jgi:hypothetical protein
MGTLEDVQTKVFSGITVSSVTSLLGWVVLGVIVIGAIGAGIWWWYTKKQFGKNITDFELINGNYVPARKDTARTLKIGSGGFEIIFLRKSKKYRLAYGARIGKDNYYFFIGQDGYPYNGLLSGILTKDGVVPVVITNPTARAQYTALEKHVDQLFSEKKTFWDQYGNWVLSGVFIMMIGIFGWLMFKEITTITSQLPPLIDKIAELVDRVNKLLVATDSLQNPGGLHTV